MPGIADHQLKVIIIIDGRRTVAIVLDELFRRHDSILLNGIEGIEELTQHIIRSALATDHIGVLTSVVLGADIVELHNSRVISIEDLRGIAQ